MLKNTASGNRLRALLLVWHLAIWSSASTHANQTSLVLYHFWKNFCGIYNFYVFVHWDQDVHNLFPRFAGYVKKKIQYMQWLAFHYQLCVWSLSLLFSYSAHNGCFFCLRSSAAFRKWWSSCHLWQYKPYRDKANKKRFYNNQLSATIWHS